MHHAQPISTDNTFIRLVFGLQPVALGAWLPQIPIVQEKLGLSPLELAWALMGMPVGLLVFLFAGGKLAEHFETRRFMQLSHIVFLAMMPLPAFAPSAASLFVALAGAGAALAAAELSLNVTADIIEKRGGSLIMASSHGCWSVGILVGSLVGSLAAGSGMLPQHIVAATATILFVPIILTAGKITSFSMGTQDPATGKSFQRYKKISIPLLGICLFAFGIALTEGAMADWAAIYLRDSFGAQAGVSGLGFTAFAVTVALGRFTGDAIRRKMSLTTVARMFSAVALAGAVVLTWAPSMEIAFAGFMLLGLGVSTGFPISVTAAGQLEGRSAARDIATLTQVSLTGFLVGPLVIGFIAEHFDMRVAIGALVPTLLASLLLANTLPRR